MKLEVHLRHLNPISSKPRVNCKHHKLLTVCQILITFRRVRPIKYVKFVDDLFGYKLYNDVILVTERVSIIQPYKVQHLNLAWISFSSLIQKSSWSASHPLGNTCTFHLPESWFLMLPSTRWHLSSHPFFRLLPTFLSACWSLGSSAIWIIHRVPDLYIPRPLAKPTQSLGSDSHSLEIYLVTLPMLPYNLGLLTSFKIVNYKCVGVLTN